MLSAMVSIRRNSKRSINLHPYWIVFVSNKTTSLHITLRIDSKVNFRSRSKLRKYNNNAIFSGSSKRIETVNIAFKNTIKGYENKTLQKYWIILFEIRPTVIIIEYFIKKLYISSTKWRRRININQKNFIIYFKTLFSNSNYKYKLLIDFSPFLLNHPVAFKNMRYDSYTLFRLHFLSFILKFKVRRIFRLKDSDQASCISRVMNF